MRKLFYLFWRILNFIPLCRVESIGKNLVLRGLIKIKRKNGTKKGNIQFGENVTINSGFWANPIGGANFTSFCSMGGNILIGNHVGISNTAFFSVSMIRVEEGANIGSGCRIWDTDFHSINPEKRLNGNIDIPSAPVIIGKNAFVGGGCIILKGVTIGENAVIGAGSVVARDIPANEVWAGNPIRFIKKIDGKQ